MNKYFLLSTVLLIAHTKKGVRNRTHMERDRIHEQIVAICNSCLPHKNWQISFSSNAAKLVTSIKFERYGNKI